MLTQVSREGPVRKRFSRFSDGHFAYGLGPAGLRRFWLRETVLFGECDEGVCWFAEPHVNEVLQLGKRIGSGGMVDARFSATSKTFGPEDWREAVTISPTAEFSPNDI